MKQVKFISSLHKSTKRDYLGRMNDDKINCMKVAKKFFNTISLIGQHDILEMMRELK